MRFIDPRNPGEKSAFGNSGQPDRAVFERIAAASPKAVNPGMATIPFFWIDAFTDQPFAGNPAGVCPLEAWLPDAKFQQMALQHGLAETAFSFPKTTGAII